MMTMDEIIADFEEEAIDDCIGLWEVVGAAEEIVGERMTGDPKESSVRRITLELVRKMLHRGFFAGDMTATSRALTPWPEQDPESVIRRIEAEWDELERLPNIGDICWFDRRDAKR